MTTFTTCNGRPKKNAIRFAYASSTTPGVVRPYQTTNATARIATCHSASRPRPTRASPLALRIALQHFGFQHVPDGFVQLDEARRQANLRDIARPRQVDGEFTDRMRRRAGRQH